MLAVDEAAAAVTAAAAARRRRSPVCIRFGKFDECAGANNNVIAFAADAREQ